MSEVEAQLEAKAIIQIENACKLLRNAISAAIPVAPEQYMTITVPGTIIDVRDLEDGGTFVYGAQYSAFPPNAVRQAEARLVDDMVALAKMMVGSTGKSVARSYSRALDSLVPKKATVRSGGLNPIRSPGEPGYDAAMKYLTTADSKTGLSPVDIYVKKQAAWANAQDEWDKAKLQAKEAAMAKYPNDIVLQRQDYDEWSQANYRKFKFAVQGRWMDWLSNGHKYDVEFNFGMIDTESIMARVESSKEAMRNSTMVDSDGANELLGVNLTPKNWATLCKEKQEGWTKRNGAYSIDQVDAEILRLQRIQISYEAMKELMSTDPPTFPISNPDVAKPSADDAASKSALAGAFKRIYTAEAGMSTQNAILSSKATDEEKNAVTTGSDYQNAVKELKEAREGLYHAIKAYSKNQSAWKKYNLAALQGDLKEHIETWLAGTIKTIQDQIAALQTKKIEKRSTQSIKVDAIASANLETGITGTEVATEGSELAAPIFNIASPADNTTGPTPTGTAAGKESNPWVTISASFSAAEQMTTQSTSSWGASVGGGAGWGLWSVGGSYAHNESHSDSTSDMANCDVSITFDAIVVNIERPWLYTEIFNDFELDVADNVYLSPGAEDLHRLMAQQNLVSSDPKDAGKANPNIISELAQYNSFPAFPTSFIIAANTTIDFHGDTQHIEDHFSAQSTSGSVSVGWGPFCARSRFQQASSKQSHQMQSTATGCRLTFGAPQIIGWVSQILPALPRKAGFEPMVQNNVAPKV
ncbi:hypothetical protein ALT_2700 [Aspergillus lentulus]|uniref:Uncharacterized protein n=1 Tax=Aspergillus lentulus TaxID=293939 RepID=A0AAN4PF76_ASPLE|nr:hypothetical protein ALT_2700 [Aspergillus lentulus]